MYYIVTQKKPGYDEKKSQQLSEINKWFNKIEQEWLRKTSNYGMRQKKNIYECKDPDRIKEKWKGKYWLKRCVFQNIYFCEPIPLEIQNKTK